MKTLNKLISRITRYTWTLGCMPSASLKEEFRFCPQEAFLWRQFSCMQNCLSQELWFDSFTVTKKKSQAFNRISRLSFWRQLFHTPQDMRPFLSEFFFFMVYVLLGWIKIGHKLLCFTSASATLPNFLWLNLWLDLAGTGT